MIRMTCLSNVNIKECMRHSDKSYVNFMSRVIIINKYKHKNNNSFSLPLFLIDFVHESFSLPGQIRGLNPFNGHHVVADIPLVPRQQVRLSLVRNQVAFHPAGGQAVGAANVPALNHVDVRPDRNQARDVINRVGDAPGVAVPDVRNDATVERQPREVVRLQIVNGVRIIKGYRRGRTNNDNDNDNV